VYGYDGQPRATYAVSGSAIATVLRKGTGQRQRVAWIVDDGAGDVLRLLDAQLAGEVALGDIDAVGIARWNYDGDGDDDLVVKPPRGGGTCASSRTSRARSTRFRRRCSRRPRPTRPSRPTPTPLGRRSATSTAMATRTCSIPVQADEMIFVHLGEPIEHRNQLPQLIEPVLYNHGSYGGDEPHGYLQVRVAEAHTIPAGATHLELVLWRKFDLEAPTEPEPQAGLSFRWDAGTSVYYTGIVEYDEPDLSVYFWTQRYVEVVNGKVVRTFPAAVYGVTADGSGGPVLDYLLAHGAVVECSTMPDQFDGFFHARTTSTIIQLVPIIDFEEDVEPGTNP
jgi:hypothetical protein